MAGYKRGSSKKRPETPRVLSRCSVCNSEDVEVLAWVLMNGDAYVDDADPSDTWCPTCEQHDIEVCRVGSGGYCLIHGRSANLCTLEFTPRAVP